MSENQLSGVWPSQALPGSWVWLSFDQFWLDFTDSQKKLPQKDYLPEGRFAVVDQGEARIGGFSNDERLLSHAPVPAIVFGDHTRAVKFINVPFIQGADGVRVLSTPMGIDRAYAFNALRAVELPDKGYSRHFKFLKATSFPLPPLAEQKRIVAKLDALNSNSARARTELSRIENLVSRYKQAVLSKAFSGALTKEWRLEHAALAGGKELRTELISKWASLQKKPSELDFSGSDVLGELPSSWTWMPVAGLATKVVDGVHKKPHYVDSGVPFITVKNLTAGPGLSFEDCRFVSLEDHKEFTKRTNPEEGDILISKDGTLGVVRAVRTSREFSIFVSVALVKPIDRSMTNYLELAFTSPILQGQMGGVGTGLQHIHLTDLRRDFVPVAPHEERHEIVRRIEFAFAKIDRLALEARRALKLVGKLDEAILAKAFRGELVPQDESDEPAEHLLERIRAERAAAPKEKTRTFRRKTTMLTARDFLKTKLENWPVDGVSFQDLRREFGGSYDDLKDAVFALVSDEKSTLQQIFDQKTSMMTIRKRGR